MCSFAHYLGRPILPRRLIIFSIIEIWHVLYNQYRMDISRKFIQMGKTRSIRYALRKGGRKYDEATGDEMKRTGEVFDEGKKKGAEVFERVLERIWGDEVYKGMFEGWKAGKVIDARKTSAGSIAGGGDGEDGETD
jgi:hypothetical protein